MAHVRRANADESPSESPPPLDQFAGARPSIPLLRHQPVSLTSSGHLETGLATQCGASRFALVAQRTGLRRTRILRLQVQSNERTGWVIELAEADRSLAPA